MRHVLVDELAKHTGEDVLLRGWVSEVRRRGAMQFVQVRDRTGTVQVTHRRSADEDVAAVVDELTRDSAVSVVGTVREGPRGGLEVAAATVEVLNRAASPLPLDGNPSVEARMDHRYLDLRSPERFLVFQVQTTFEAAVRQFLLDRRFVEIHSPKICAGGSESGADVFEVPYFGETAYLIQSTQFYKQLAMAAGFDRVFEIGPIFRAERSNSNRHATEFTCIDFEISWIESHEDLMSFEEELLRHSLSVVREAHGDEVRRAFGVEVEVPDEPIPRVTLEFAHDLARKAGGSTSAAGDDRLNHLAEQLVSRYALEEHRQSFVFVTDYPVDERPFYHMRHEDRPGLTRSFDLLWRGIEITTGGQREHRYDRLCAQAADAGLDEDVMASYLRPYFLEMFRWGCPPHGGFGIGLERFLMALMAQPSVRDTALVYRGPNRFVP